jgi:hypothetical protein
MTYVPGLIDCYREEFPRGEGLAFLRVVNDRALGKGEGWEGEEEGGAEEFHVYNVSQETVTSRGAFVCKIVSIYTL